MSRLNITVDEANRLAFNQDQAKIKQDAVTAKWLKDNPQIGALTSGKFYYFNDDNEMVMVQPPKQ